MIYPTRQELISQLRSALNELESPHIDNVVFDIADTDFDFLFDDEGNQIL